jgi:hypothetical protein
MAYSKVEKIVNRLFIRISFCAMTVAKKLQTCASNVMDMFVTNASTHTNAARTCSYRWSIVLEWGFAVMVARIQLMIGLPKG